MELNTVSLNDFVKLAGVIWLKAYASVVQVMRGSGLVKEYPIPQNSGNTREFSEIDSEEYAKAKGEGSQAERAKVQQGLTSAIVLIKSFLIYGENPAVDNALQAA